MSVKWFQFFVPVLVILSGCVQQSTNQDPQVHVEKKDNSDDREEKKISSASRAYDTIKNEFDTGIKCITMKDLQQRNVELQEAIFDVREKTIFGFSYQPEFPYFRYNEKISKSLKTLRRKSREIKKYLSNAQVVPLQRDITTLINDLSKLSQIVERQTQYQQERLV